MPCGTFTNVLRYGNLEFSMMLTLHAGHVLRASRLPAINMVSGRIGTTGAAVAESWTPQNTQTDIPKVLFSNNTQEYNSHRAELFQYANLHILNAGSLRIRNLSLAYRLPAHWCKAVALSGARVQFNVENAATFAFDSKAKYDLGVYNKPAYVWSLHLNF